MTAHSPPDSSASSPRGADGNKRARILEAAEKVFAERGFFHARVSEIAREAGVADGTIYLYFKNKDDLLISVFESRMEHLNRELAQVIATAGPRFSDRLGAFMAAYASMVIENPSVASVLTVELRQSSKFMREHPATGFSDFLKIIAGLIADGQKAGEFDPEMPAPVVARAIFGMLDELALAWLLGRGEKFDMVRAASALSSLILRGLERRHA